MAKKSGLGDRLFVAGYNLSGDIGSVGKISGGPAALDRTSIGSYGMERVGGLRDGGIDFSAWLNTATDAAHDRLSTLPVADVVVTYARGTSLGDPGAGEVAKQINYDGKHTPSGGMSWEVVSQANGFGVEWGQQGTPGIRTDTTATNGASLDGGAATAFGLQAYLQVFALTGTSCTVTVQDSADNVSFAAVTGGAFTAATGPTSQRIATASGATIRRYLRVATTGTFTNCQFHVLLVRNDTAVSF